MSIRYDVQQTDFFDEFSAEEQKEWGDILSIRYDVQQTDFFNELSAEEQKEYFNVKSSKFLHSIDNIYYSCFIDDDFNGNGSLKELFVSLDELKIQAMHEHEPQPFNNESLVVLPYGTPGGVSYKYCISMPDMYDIFILDYLPNDDTPRIQVQIRAHGLWIYGSDKMLLDSYNMVSAIFSEYGCNISKCRENRIDYWLSHKRHINA